MDFTNPRLKKQWCTCGAALCAQKNGSQLHKQSKTSSTLLFNTTSSHQGFEMNGQNHKGYEGPRLHDGIAFNQDFYLYTEVYQDVNVGW